MPVTYYTQEEVDELVSAAKGEAVERREKFNSLRGRLTIRAFILYTLNLPNMNASQLRKTLEEYSSMEQIRKEFPNEMIEQAAMPHDLEG